MVAVLAILPIFGLIVLGYVLGRKQWLSQEASAGLASITFKLFMPTLLFIGIAKAPLAEGLSPILLLAYYGPALMVFCSVNWIAQRITGHATATGLAATFSNNVLVGIPLVTTLLGHDGLVYVFAILVFHSLTLFSLQSIYAAFGSTEQVNFNALLKNLANPMIIGLILGALLNLSGITVITPLWQMIEWLAQAALPCALIVLGVSLSGYRLRPTTTVVALSCVKLLVFPLLVFISTALVPTLNPAARTVLVLMAACPCGVNILAFAKTQQDTRNISSTISLSTVMAALTLPVWVFVLQH